MGFSCDEVVENKLRIRGTQVWIDITYSAELFKHNYSGQYSSRAHKG